MKKIIVVDAVDFYFPTVRAINAETGKMKVMEDVSKVDDVEKVLKKVGGERFKVVYVTRVDQDELRKKISKNGFREGRIYSIHDDLRKDDLSCDMRMIMEYDGVGKDELCFMSKKLKDLVEVKNMGIKCYGLDGERWD